MNKYKSWEVFEEMPAGFNLHPACGSPLHQYAFASNGHYLTPGFKMILVRVVCLLKK